MPLWGAAIAAAVGILKSEAIDRPAEARKRKLAAETERLSPWTGMHGQAPQETDTLGSGLQHGLTGFQIGQGYDQSQLNQKITNKYLEQQAPQDANPWVGNGIFGSQQNYLDNDPTKNSNLLMKNYGGY